MTTKTCFKCLRALDLSDFYKHPRMGDGHLGKCKDCTRADTEDRRKKLEATNADWVLSERERHRIKQRDRRAKGIGIQTAAEAMAARNAYRSKFPEKHTAKNALSYAVKKGRVKKKPCEVCGKEKAQAHHDDYSKPLDVRWLCVKHHNEHHVAERNAAAVAKFITLNPPQ